MTTMKAVSLSGLSEDYYAKRKHRPIREIAGDICLHWKNVYYGAVPYLEAMEALTDITDTFGQDSAESVVNYFLANANTWRGEEARKLKAELKVMLPK